MSGAEWVQHVFRIAAQALYLLRVLVEALPTRPVHNTHRRDYRDPFARLVVVGAVGALLRRGGLTWSNLREHASQVTSPIASLFGLSVYLACGYTVLWTGRAARESGTSRASYRRETRTRSGILPSVPFKQIPAKLEARVHKMEQEAEVEALGAWTGYTRDRDQVLLVIFPNQCRVVTPPSGQQVWPRDKVRVSASTVGLDCLVTVAPITGRTIQFSADRPDALGEIRAALVGLAADDVEPDLGLSRSRVVTLSELPGHRITAVHGVVSGVGALSGWTAAEKGRGAVDRAFPDLLASAQRLGANAVIGLQGSPFGAGGGITNMLGGDAVGVLLIGTAVTAVPLEGHGPSATPTEP